MRNKKDQKLVNIYIRIHNGQVLTMDDLAYLARYNPICFKKTCDNLIYKKRETKTAVKAPGKSVEKVTEKTMVSRVKRKVPAEHGRSSFELTADEILQNERMIEQVMDSFKKLDSSELGKVSPLQNIDMWQVKELIGELFEESLFLNNGTQMYFNAAAESGSRFNVSV